MRFTFLFSIFALTCACVSAFGFPKPNSVGCGKQAVAYKPVLKKNLRIIGGTEAKAHSWPWLATYTIYVPEPFESLDICGSSLLRVKENVEESDIVLTAAHCVTKKETMAIKPEKHDASFVSATVEAGNHRREQKDKGEEMRKAVDFRFHPDFSFNDTTGMNNDVALVKLDKPIKFSNTIRPVCLPAAGEPLPVGKTCVAAGWGRNNSKTYEYPDTLQQLVAPVHNASVCSAGWTYPWGSVYKEEQMICAGSLKALNGVCSGDSGGMLACQRGDHWILYGTPSFVTSDDETMQTCLSVGKPAMFARVSSYVGWITKNMREMSSV